MLVTLGSGGSRGGARGAAPVIFRPGRKKFFVDHPPYLRVWMTRPPLSQGMDLALLGTLG